ncbi:hypothetical protein [Actinomadura madurae]|uniref:hypothetical protein n=1 Tax=Actinomadura madurae TaxID=1993 RepID=UPI002025E05B|nr:hypothetical protein [Actinomadura madurae]MCP9955692.1 hypothetical protein [Actinomadura madurae]MCP9972424.1 hypothetical protein [Actinomadura madurae]MCP9984937.1 hypothetical protein [Actinomadura madurae]MCQ0003505.1 hypothetical protein [Actinomadura madurae]MCQ0021132.1 hypothetical protein [Actinomadura madurae]
MTERDSDAMMRVIRQTASRLFGELGYDNTNLRMIGDAVGLAPEVVEELSGGKKCSGAETRTWQWPSTSTCSASGAAIDTVGRAMDKVHAGIALEARPRGVGAMRIPLARS